MMMVKLVGYEIGDDKGKGIVNSEGDYDDDK